MPARGQGTYRKLLDCADRTLQSVGALVLSGDELDGIDMGNLAPVSALHWYSTSIEQEKYHG